MPTRQQITIRERHKLIDEQKRIVGELERLRGRSRSRWMWMPKRATPT